MPALNLNESTICTFLPDEEFILSSDPSRIYLKKPYDYYEARSLKFLLSYWFFDLVSPKEAFFE